MPLDTHNALGYSLFLITVHYKQGEHQATDCCCLFSHRRFFNSTQKVVHFL